MMHDGEPSEAGIPLPIQPDPVGSSNKILVVATLAALVIAGSAIVYRTRPYYYSSVKTSSTTPTASTSVVDKGSTQKGKQRKVLVDLDQESNGNGDEDVDGDRNDSAASFDPESSTAREKEGKTVRSKDRRRRGKDPLKEMLKGKSKSGKAFEYSLLHSHPSSPSASSTFNHDTNYSSSSSKPNSGVKGTNSGGSRSSTKNVASGSTSGPAMDLESTPTQLPEISQRQRQRNSRSPPPQSPYASHASPAVMDPYHQDRELSQTTEICSPHYVAEGGSPSPSPSHSLPHASSSLHPYPSLASSQSASTRNSDADADADHIYTRAQSPDSDQARPRRVGSLAGESAGTSLRGGVDGEELEPDSGAETEATAAMSMSSSFVLSESGKHRREREAEEEGTPATSPACSERSVSTPRVDAQVTKKAGRRKAARPSSKQGAKLDQSQASDPWDWDGAGAGQVEVTSSVSSSSSRKEKGAEWDEAHQPPNGSVAASTTSTYPSFSSVAGASSTATSTSLNQPTNVAGSTLGMSTSATAPGTGNIGNANVPPLPMDEDGDFGDKDKENEKADEEQAFTFPTLNPVASATATTGADSSRTRSSQGDIYAISNTNNINTAHGFGSPSIGGRRAPTPRRPPTPSRNNTSHSRNASNGSTPPPLRPMTPGSNSTGLASPSILPANGAMPALSTQTQLASLRGALEASRLREEKSKAEMERYAKETETIKWENTNLGRINMELQTHIRSLTHQLQTYNALFAAAPHLQQQYVNGPVGTPGAGSAAATVYPGNAGTSSSPSSPTPQDSSTTITNNTSNSASAPQHLPQQLPSQSSPPHPLHLHLLQMNSMMSPTGIPSPSLGGGPMSPTYPIGPYPGVPSPFFPYSIPPHLHSLPHPLTVSHAQQAHMQQQFHQSLSQAQAQAQPSSHQASLFSMIFPTGSQAYPAYSAPANVPALTETLFGSGSSSATGASSAGSLSPDLNGSPSSGETALKKKRSRTRTQTANGRMGGRAGWEDGPDGWIAGFTEDDRGKEEDFDHDPPKSLHDDGDDEDQEIESGFNELLADAILKRPGSMRRVSSRKGKLHMEKDSRTDSEDKDSASPVERSAEASEEQLTEFTFPSLSNLGNVSNRSGWKAATGEYSSSSLSSSSTSPSPAVASVIPEDVSESPVLVDADEERPHPLPPLIEQAEDTEISAETQDVQPSTEELEAQEMSKAPLSSPESEATPRKEKLDSELTELAMGTIKEVDGWTISC